MNVFPHSKIKAQIIEDENIGRISSKAVELISACSALLVRDLVVQDYCSSDGKSVIKSSLREGTEVTEGTISMKNDKCDDGETSPIDLAFIKHRIQRRPEYDFLECVIDELTEKNSPKYDTAARKRKRQRCVDPKKQSTSSNNNKNNHTVFTNLTCDTKVSSMNNEDASVGAQKIALQEAVNDARDNTTSIHATKEIIADDDDYD